MPELIDAIRPQLDPQLPRHTPACLRTTSNGGQPRMTTYQLGQNAPEGCGMNPSGDLLERGEHSWSLTALPNLAGLLRDSGVIELVPDPIRVGDTVRTPFGESSPWRGVVVWVEGDRAWVDWASTSRTDSTIAKVADLVRVDP